MTHIMLDLETLGTKPGCAIVSIGACRFSLDGIHDEFYKVIDINTMPVELKIEAGTVAWWMQQSAEAREIFRRGSPMSPFVDVLFGFDKWMQEMRVTASPEATEPMLLWGHGAAFDAPILEAIYHAIGQKFAVPFYNWRDTRTLYALSGIGPNRKKGTHHNALDAAKAQALAVIGACRKLNVELA